MENTTEKTMLRVAVMLTANGFKIAETEWELVKVTNQFYVCRRSPKDEKPVTKNRDKTKYGVVQHDYNNDTHLIGYGGFVFPKDKEEFIRKCKESIINTFNTYKANLGKLEPHVLVETTGAPENNG